MLHTHIYARLQRYHTRLRHVWDRFTTRLHSAVYGCIGPFITFYRGCTLFQLLPTSAYIYTYVYFGYTLHTHIYIAAYTRLGYTRALHLHGSCGFWTFTPICTLFLSPFAFVAFVHLIFFAVAFSYGLLYTVICVRSPQLEHNADFG